MKNKANNTLKPIFSVFLIVMTLFSLVFFKMEIRRMGYSVLKQSRIFRGLQDNYQLKVINYAKLTSSENLRKMAISKFTLSEAKVGQIIYLIGDRIALEQ